MFVPDFKQSIPGYTGHKRQNLETGSGPDLQQTQEPRKQIPGYGGYIPGIKSENVFGETYGKTSFASKAQTFARGIDQPVNIKYNSIMKEQFVDHAFKIGKIETTAQIVGVQRGEDLYKKPIPPSQYHAFYGSETPAEIEKEQKSNEDAQTNYKLFLEQQKQEVKSQEYPQALEQFFAIDQVPDSQKVQPLGEPIPGYSGVNRRIQADNVFGMTYAEARRMAGESLLKIQQEKSETLKETSKWKK